MKMTALSDVTTQSIRRVKRVFNCSVPIALALAMVFAYASSASAQQTVSSIIAGGNNTAVTLGPTGSPLTQPTITAVLSQAGVIHSNFDPTQTRTYSNWAFLVNDGTGSLEVFGPMPTGSTYVPTVGDIISVSGPYGPFNQIPEIGGTGTSRITAISQVGTGGPVPAPQVVTIPDINSSTPNYDILGHLLTLQGVKISGATGNFSYTSTQSLTVTDLSAAANSMVLFYWPTSYSAAFQNLSGTPIPTVPQNITGFWSIFGSTAEFIPVSMSPFQASLPGNAIFWYPNNPAGGGSQGGSGTWDTAALNWNQNSNGNGSNITFTADKFAVFGGAAATNNVSVPAGGVTANGIDFASNDYVVSGGPITIGGTLNTIDVATGATATINSQIQGTNGLNLGGTLFGQGTLVLNPATNESLSGDLAISSGTLQVASLSKLGTTFGNLIFGGGGLKITTAGSYSLDASHSVLGSVGVLDLPAGSTLTINGTTASDGTGANSPFLTLPNATTLVLANDGSTTGGKIYLGGITFGSNGTLTVGNGTGTVSLNGNLTASATSGNTTVNGGVDFGSTGGRFINVAAGGTLKVTGNIVGGGGTLSVTGLGTADLQGDNSGYHATIAIGTTRSGGPTVKVYNAGSIGGSVAGSGITVTDNLNGGTLLAINPVVFDSLLGISVGAGGSLADLAAQPSVAATLAGADMEFKGPVAFFKASSNPPELRLTVNNNTTFSGGLGALTGSGTVNSIVLSGSGTLNISTANGGTMAEELPIIVDGLRVNVNAPMTANTANFRIEGGGKVTSGVDNALPTGSALTLGDATRGGGTFATAGHAQQFDTLTVLSDSTVDFGTGTSILQINASSDKTWSGVLRLNNWTGNLAGNGADQFLIANDAGTLAGLSSAQLGEIHFTGYLTGAKLLANGANSEVVPLSSVTLILGDVNQDHSLTPTDIPAMLSALTDLNSYAAAHPVLDSASLLDVLDTNRDGKVTNADIQSLLDMFVGTGSVASVPEPSSALMGLVAIPALFIAAGRRRFRAG